MVFGYSGNSRDSMRLAVMRRVPSALSRGFLLARAGPSARTCYESNYSIPIHEVPSDAENNEGRRVSSGLSDGDPNCVNGVHERRDGTWRVGWK